MVHVQSQPCACGLLFACACLMVCWCCLFTCLLVDCRFATRISNVFVIGRGNKPLVTLPKGKGVRPTILQEQAKRFGSA